MGLDGAELHIWSMTTRSSVVHSEEEVLGEFQECCEAEAEAPGLYTYRLKIAAEDLCHVRAQKRRRPG